MIRHRRNGLKATFGFNTVRISSGIRTLFLQACQPSTLNEDVPKESILRSCPRIALEFNSLESIQVLIDRLEILKEVMEKERG